MEQAARCGWRHVFHVLLYGLFTYFSTSCRLLTCLPGLYTCEHQRCSIYGVS